MLVETYASLKEQLYSRAALDFSGSEINAINLRNEYAETEPANDGAGACKGTAGTFGTICGLPGHLDPWGLTVAKSKRKFIEPQTSTMQVNCMVLLLKNIMKIKIYPLSLILFLGFYLFSFKLSAQNIQEIISKHIQNVGGEANLNKLENVVFDQQLMTNNTEFTQKLIIVNNKSYYMETRYPGKTIIIAVNDSTGWQINPYSSSGKTPVKLTSKEVSNYKYLTDLSGPLYKNVEKGIVLKLLGKEKINGEETFKVEVSYKSGYTMHIFVSCKSYMINRIMDKYRMVNYSDYKKVNGVAFPFVTELKYGTQTIICNAIKIKTNQVIDDKIFHFPG